MMYAWINTSYTKCPRSLNPLYTVIYYIKRIKSSWTYCIYCYMYKMIRSGNWSGSWSISGFTTQYLARFCRYREERKRFTLINKDISCYIKRVKTSWTYCRYCYIYRIIRIRLMTRILIHIRIYSTKSLVRKYFGNIERRGEEWICIMYLYFKLTKPLGYLVHIKWSISGSWPGYWSVTGSVSAQLIFSVLSVLRGEKKNGYVSLF